MLWGLLEYLSSILFFFLHITSAGSFPKALTAAEEKKYLEQMAAGDHHARIERFSDVIISAHFQPDDHI